jgi:hypothetical protein
VNELRFEIADGCLYAANTGRGFDRTGVVSICSQHLSAKSARADKIETLPCPDADLVAAIRKKRIQLYNLDPNLLLADRNAEEEASEDYVGRCLLELLQNGDDAMAPDSAPNAELIGSKGLGFKSVLEITDAPQIFSGPFRFGFDQTRSRACLANLEVGEEVSVFHIPHTAEGDVVVERLLKAGFATVIKLPLRDVTAIAHLEAELATLEPYFLLLSQHLERVDIRFGAIRRLLIRKGARGSSEGADASLQVRYGRQVEHESNWRVWCDIWPAPRDKHKRLSVAMAIQMKDGRLVPTDTPMPLHVFYPTEEQVSADFLIHAALDVAQNRQHVRASANDSALLERIGNMTARIAASQPPLEVLQVFRRIVQEAPRYKPKKLASLIRYMVRKALIETEFVPVIGRGARKVAPRQARAAATGFSGLLNPAAKRVANAEIVRPELEPAYPVLSELEGGQLDTSDYAQLFRHVRCTTIPACLVAARTMLRICLSGIYVSEATLAALREAAIWPVNGGRVRALSDPTPLLLAKPDHWPSWCEADALEPGFAQALFAGGAIPKEWAKLVADMLLTNNDQYLARCVAPTVARWNDEQWAELGWEVLECVERWAGIGEWTKLRPYAPRANLGTSRDALAAVMRVPAGKGWLRARHCYARSEIKGPTGLSRYFKSVPGRALCGYPSEAKQRFSADRWRALLRFLGVSWEPKILLLPDDVDAVLEVPDQSAFRREMAYGIRYLHKDWYLEAFPACLANTTQPAALMDMIASLQLTSAALRGEWFKVAGTDKTHAPEPFHSFVQYQLRCVPFLPVKANIWSRTLSEGREAYWPQSGIPGITPDLDLSGFKDPRCATLKPLLAAALGFKSKLPDRWSEWLRWNNALVSAADRGHVPSIRAIRELYERMLDPRNGGKEGTKPAKVVCVDPTSPSGFKAVPRAKAAWIDKPALAAPEVLEALAAAGLPYLPTLLDTAAGASEQLGITPASKMVEVAPRYDEASGSQAKLERRLDARWLAIAVQCEAKRVRLPLKPTLRAVHGLNLAVSFDGKPAAVIASAAFKQDGAWLIDVGNEWEAVATALSDGIGHAADLRYRFAAILRAPNRASVTRLLIEDGIPSYKLTTLKLDEDDESETKLVGGEQGSEANDPSAESQDDPPTPANEDSSGTRGAPPPSPPPPPPPQPDRPAGNQFASGNLSQRPLYDPPTKEGGSRSGSSGWSGRQFEAGLAGEQWLRQLMATKLPASWTLTLNERDEDAGESDIIVRRDGAEWHIEVKTLSGERLYWSDFERRKAERQPGRYWMCFLVRQGYAWRIHWSWDPLVDLLVCERRVQWQWARESEGPRLANDSWEPIGGLAAPSNPPDRATAVIRILDAQVRALPEDDQGLSLFWQRVHDAASQSGAR